MRKPTLAEFLASGKKNEWIQEGLVSAYVRRTSRSLGEPWTRPRMWTCLDVATVSVPANERRKGHFRAFLDYAEATCGAEAVYIESIMDGWLAEAVVRWGYSLIMIPLCPNAYKILRGNHGTQAEEPTP